MMDISSWSGDDRKITSPMSARWSAALLSMTTSKATAAGSTAMSPAAADGGHAVMVIGYDDNAQCWICRNSWGDGFSGPRADGTGAGFFKIMYGQCDIDGEDFFGAQGIIEPASLNWGAGGASRAASPPPTRRYSVCRDRLTNLISSCRHDDGTYTAAWQPGDAHWGGWWRVQRGVSRPTPLLPAFHGRQTNSISLHRHRQQGLYCGVAAGRHDLAGLVAGGQRSDHRGHLGVRRVAFGRQAGHLSPSAATTDYTAAWQPGEAAGADGGRVQSGSQHRTRRSPRFAIGR